MHCRYNGAHRTTGRAPSEVPEETAVPFYEKGNVRIRYETVGSGFPLLVTPGGGLNSRVSNWPTAVFNAMEVFKDDFRFIDGSSAMRTAGSPQGRFPPATPGARSRTISWD